MMKPVICATFTFPLTLDGALATSDLLLRWKFAIDANYILPDKCQILGGFQMGYERQGPGSRGESKPSVTAYFECTLNIKVIFQNRFKLFSITAESMPTSPYYVQAYNRICFKCVHSLLNYLLNCVLYVPTLINCINLEINMNLISLTTPPLWWRTVCWGENHGNVSFDQMEHISPQPDRTTLHGPWLRPRPLCFLISLLIDCWFCKYHSPSKQTKWH